MCNLNFSSSFYLIFFLFVNSKELPKNGRSKRIAKGREPKIYENVKNAMFIKGHKSSQTLNNLMNDLVRKKLFFSFSLFFY